MLTALSWILMLAGVAIVVASMIARPQAKGTAMLGGALAVVGWFANVVTSWWAVTLVIACIAWVVFHVYKTQGVTNEHNAADVQRNQSRAFGHGAAALAVFAIVGLAGTFIQWNHDHPAAPTASIVTPWTNDDGTSIKATAEEIGRTENVQAPKVAERVHYHAYDAPKGVNNFGQNRDPKTADEAVGQLKLLAAEDPVEFAAIVEARKNGVDAANDNGTTARQWLNDHSKWQSAIDGYFADTSFVLVDAGDIPYYSLGAIRDASGNREIMPKLTQLTELQKLGKVLIVLNNKGEAVQLLRVPCDYQPSMPKPFKNVPTPNGEQPKQPGPRPETPSTPTTRTTTPRTTPSTPTTSTTPSTPTTTTTTTTTTTSTPPNECPPGQFWDEEGKECLNSKPSSEGPSLPVSPQPTPSGPSEDVQPTETNPAVPIPTDDPAPDVEAPGATDVPDEPRDPETLPPTADNAPDTTDRGDESGDPDGQQQTQNEETQDEPAAVVDGEHVENMAYSTALKDSGPTGQWMLIIASMLAGVVIVAAWRRR